MNDLEKKYQDKIDTLEKIVKEQQRRCKNAKKCKQMRMLWCYYS